MMIASRAGSKRDLGVYMLSAEQKALITATVPVLEIHGLAIVRNFYQRLFDRHPDLKQVFNMANQAAGHQQKALAAAVYAYAANIDNLAALKPALSRIAHKHAALGVRPEQYPVVGENLLDAIKDVLGEAATPAIIAAWGAAFGLLAEALIGEEAKLYAQAESAPGGWRGLREFVVARKEPESDEITSFYLRPRDGGPVMPFLPGQFITVAVYVPGLGHTQLRHYSLSDAPGGDGYRISVKREARDGAARAGSVSNLLHDNVQVGDTLLLGPPFGDFHLDLTPTTPVVLISAGVGLTPMMSMLNSLCQSDNAREVVFVHGARHGRAHALRKYLQDKINEHSRLRALIFYSSPENTDVAGTDYHHTGRINLEKVKDQVLRPDADYFLCGPAGFMREQANMLRSLGIAEPRIHYEAFGPEA